MKPVTRSRAGFTILEVVLALSILLIGMTTILGLLTFGAGLAHSAEQRTGAAMGIEAVVADLEENLFPLQLENGQEVAGEPVDVRDRTVPGYPRLTYSATATPDPRGVLRPGVPVEYRVDVEVSWSGQGLERTTRFTTLLLREVPFGERLRRRFVEQREPEPIETGPTPEDDA